MSGAEYRAMLNTGKVQESYSGTTHVLLPPDWYAFSRQARPGDLYVEFDVPAICLKVTGNGWAKIIGPHTLEARIAIRNGLPAPQMPPALYLRHVASKTLFGRIRRC
ncbi:MAG: hypothetical protein ABW202_22705 [Duganella sp.]